MATPTGAPLVLFDGMCGFCSASVRFIIHRDRRRVFTFASLQSQSGRKTLGSHGLGEDTLDTLVLVEEGRCFTRSTALLRICRRLSGLWPFLYVLIIFPRFLRDAFYDGFARNRYRWFTRRETCFLPGPDERDRFLDGEAR